MNAYAEMKKRHQEEVNSFPIKFAFDKKQLEKGLAELGLNPDDTDKVCRVPAGGFIRKTDLPALKEMLNRHIQERADAVNSDKTGKKFVFQMFYTELAEREYGYTGDADDTLEALGYTYEDIEKNENLKTGFTLAAEKIMGRDCF